MKYFKIQNDHIKRQEVIYLINPIVYEVFHQKLQKTKKTIDSHIDKWNLYSVGKYCDELVPTGYSGRFSNIDFTIDPGGVIVSIDDSTTQFGEETLKTRFPQGGIVCLFETKNAAGTDLDTSYKRLIISPEYSSDTFTFKIVLTNF